MNPRRAPDELVVESQTQEMAVAHSTTDEALNERMVTHPLDSEDAAVMKAVRAMVSPSKGLARGIEARQPFLALVLASRVTTEDFFAKAALVGVAAMSPVTDLSLSGETYETRADADPFFTRPQVAELVHAYLGGVDPKHPMASPLYSRFSGLPAIRIDVGDDEVLLDDSRRYVERAVATGVDARLDVWMGMPHGFVANIGRVKASAQALDAVGAFLTEKLRANTTPRR
jgi:hypothetical protein